MEEDLSALPEKGRGTRLKNETISWDNQQTDNDQMCGFATRPVQGWAVSTKGAFSAVWGKEGPG